MIMYIYEHIEAGGVFKCFLSYMPPDFLRHILSYSPEPTDSGILNDHQGLEIPLSPPPTHWYYTTLPDFLHGSKD